jgi:hypothetical protein
MSIFGRSDKVKTSKPSEKKPAPKKEEVVALFERHDKNGQKYYVGNMKECGTRVIAFYTASEVAGVPALKVYKALHQGQAPESKR